MAHVWRISRDGGKKAGQARPELFSLLREAHGFGFPALFSPHCNCLESSWACCRGALTLNLLFITPLPPPHPPHPRPSKVAWWESRDKKMEIDFYWAGKQKASFRPCG